MALPLPRVVADVGPGGSITTAMRGQNALTKSALENMFYAPNIKSEIDYRNAMKNRANTLTPLEAAKMQLDNDYYVSKAKSLMDLQNAQTNKINYVLTHPGYMGGEDTKTIQSLIDLGLIPGNSIKPASIQNNNPPIGIPQSVTTQNTDMLQGNSRLVPAPATNNLNFTIPPQNQNPVDMNPQQNNPVANMGFSGNPAAPFNTGNPLVDNILNRRYAQPAYTKQMSQAFDWVHSTPEAKTYEIALGAGMGLTPDQFVHERTQGKSIYQIAEKHGFDPKNLPAPDFLPTRQNITQLKKRQSALKEVDSLGKFVREGLAPYSRKFKGYSPKQIVDSLRGKNKEQQKKFFAAMMLTPELANIRQNLAQGNAGVTAAEEIMKRSLMNVNVFESLVDEDVFLGAQKLADKKLKEAFSNAEKVYQVPGKKNEKSKTEKWGRDSNGNLVRISS